MGEITRSLDIKYRPKNIEEMYGNENIKSFLKSLKKSIPNTILLLGESGNGKTTTARLIAKYINCKTNNACGECNNCKSIDKGSHPDIKEVNTADARGIDEMREIINTSRLMPLIGKYRVIILDEIHQATPQALQAMLKPLEEPSENTVYILCTTDPQKLPKTILTRCTKLQVQSLSDDESRHLIVDILKKEKVYKKLKSIDEKYTKKLINTVIDTSYGSIRSIYKSLELIIANLDDNIDFKKLIVNITNSNDDLDKIASDIAIKIYELIYNSELKADGKKAKDLDVIISDILNTITKEIKDYVSLSNDLLFINTYITRALSSIIQKEKPRIFGYLYNVYKKVSSDYPVYLNSLMQLQQYLINYRKEVMEFSIKPEYSIISLLYNIAKIK